MTTGNAELDAAMHDLRREVELLGDGPTLRALEKVERIVGVKPADVFVAMHAAAEALPSEACTIDPEAWALVSKRAPPYIHVVHVRRSVEGEIPGVFVVWYHGAPVAGKEIDGFFAAVIDVEALTSRPLGRHEWRSGHWLPEDA